MADEASKAKAMEMLKALDKDNSGYLDKAELKAGLQAIYRFV